MEKAKKARLLFSKFVISGTRPSDWEVLVVETNDGNVGGCHDTKMKPQVMSLMLKMLILRKESKQRYLNN